MCPRSWPCASEPEVIRFTSVPVPYSADDAQLWLDLHPAGWPPATARRSPSPRAATTVRSDRSACACCTTRARPRPATTSSTRRAGAAWRPPRSDCSPRWTFAELEVGRLQLTTHLDNPASQRVAEKAGFTREGVLRAWADQRGERVDLVMWSLLPGDPMTTVGCGCMPVVESHAAVAARPADVFAFLHDPAQRPVWDVAVDLCNLEGRERSPPAAGSTCAAAARRPRGWASTCEVDRAAAVGAAPRGRRRHAVLGLPPDDRGRRRTAARRRSRSGSSTPSAGRSS